MTDHGANLVFYGQPKIGKSTFVSKFNKPIFLATEPSLRYIDVDKKDIKNWVDLVNLCATMTGDFQKNKFKYETIVIDTLSNAYEMCREHINKKNNVDHEADLPYGKGFSLVYKEFKKIINCICFFPVPVVFICHDEDRQVDSQGKQLSKKSINLSAKMSKWILGLVDIIGYCYVKPESGDRRISFLVNDEFESGDRTGELKNDYELDINKIPEMKNNLWR